MVELTGGATNAAALRFTDAHLTPPELSPLDVKTTLRHFALITYDVDAAALATHLHPKFDPFVTEIGGRRRALLSAVPFIDIDFRFVACPWPALSFGQTNYRAYVIDSETGEHAVWFFGTCVDSWTVLVPQRFWKLPWYRGRVRFDCDYDTDAARYRRYSMHTDSAWSPAEVELADTGEPVRRLDGFESMESALVILTHPLRGYYYRRDGLLGSYSVWHDKFDVTVGSCVKARFDLLEDLGLVSRTEQTRPHSVLIQHETEFTVQLPPRIVETGGFR